MTQSLAIPSPHVRREPARPLSRDMEGSCIAAATDQLQSLAAVSEEPTVLPVRISRPARALTVSQPNCSGLTPAPTRYVCSAQLQVHHSSVKYRDELRGPHQLPLQRFSSRYRH